MLTRHAKNPCIRMNITGKIFHSISSGVPGEVMVMMAVALYWTKCHARDATFGISFAVTSPLLLHVLKRITCLSCAVSHLGCMCALCYGVENVCFFGYFYSKVLKLSLIQRTLC